ncbi:MAG: YDG domain-containing protein, partial [Rhodanobacter sp.]
GSNYTLIGGNDALTINQAVINLSGTRQYNGGTGAGASAFGNNGVINTGVNGETITLTGAGDVAGANVDSYTGANFNAGTLALTNGSGSASNYTLVGGNDNLAITPYVLDLNGSRAYDSTTGANANLFGNNGVLAGVNGETLTLSGSGTASSANASANPYTGIGSSTNTGQGFNLNTLALTANGSALASNYTLIGGNDALAITQAVINLSSTRSYDGTTGANANLFGNNGVLTGVNGETLTLTGAGTVAGANVGSYAGTNFNLSTLALSSGTGAASNYTLAGGSDALAITPYVLNLTGTRVYDATTGANANLFGNNGVLTGVNGETLTLGGAGLLSTKNVGNQLVFASNGLNGFTLAGNGSALAGNYTLTGGTDWVSITPLAITVSATGQGKVYDDTTTAGVTLASHGVLLGDTVNFSDGAANFGSPNAGSSVSITVSSITASGTDAGNYTFNNTATTSATISPYVLNLTGTRVYDGNTDADAHLFGNNGVLAGLNGQTLMVSGSGVLSSKNVGSQRGFANLGSLVLGNGSGLAGNYTLAGGTDWVTITPAMLTVIGTNTTNRVYDGTTTDALNGATLSGVFGNDNVLLGNDTAGQFGDKNVGNGKAVSTAMTVSGADAGNYILVQPTGLTANITPLAIAVNATGTNRMYNGQVGDVVSLTVNGVLPGDVVSVTNGSANFADPYVGNNKTVTVSGIAAFGADASNYVIADPLTTTTANITSEGFTGSGVQGSWIAQLQGGLQPLAIATPYGSADADAVGVFTGNQKRMHRPVERNRTRTDFRSGLSLQYQNGGVRLPSDASP